MTKKELVKKILDADFGMFKEEILFKQFTDEEIEKATDIEIVDSGERDKLGAIHHVVLK